MFTIRVSIFSEKSFSFSFRFLRKSPKKIVNFDVFAKISTKILRFRENFRRKFYVISRKFSTKIFRFRENLFEKIKNAQNRLIR